MRPGTRKAGPFAAPIPPLRSGEDTFRAKSADLVFSDDHGHGEVAGVGDREREAADAKAGGDFGGAAVEDEFGALAGFTCDFELRPADAAADAGSEGFGGGFLGGEARSEAFAGVFDLAAAVGDFACGVDTRQKAVAEAGKRMLDPSDFHHVRTDAEDHLSSVVGAGWYEADSSTALRNDRGRFFGMSEEVRIERLAGASAEALEIVNEYYEAVQVVVRDTPEALEALIGDPEAGFWLARIGNSVVGCVVLRGLGVDSGECKRLYVRPSARGRKVGDRLMDALENHARTVGMRWVYLDSKDDLKPAIALYEKRGYESCARYNDNPQATVFLRKRL